LSPVPGLIPDIYRMRAEYIMRWFDQMIPCESRNPEEYELISYCVLTYSFSDEDGQGGWDALTEHLHREYSQYKDQHTAMLEAWAADIKAKKK
jgi:hypothetical protein